MSKVIREETWNRGYCFVAGLDPEKNSVTIAGEFGALMEPWEGGLVQRLTPRSTDTPNTYSGMYGLGRFPFHTDLAHWRRPPRYLMLRCVKGYRDVPTLLLDGKDLIEKITLDVLARGVVKPRRPQAGSVPLLRLLEATDSGYLLRWDEVFLQSASKIGDFASQRVLECLAQAQPLSIALAQPGDTVLIDNWRMLHARSPIPAGRENRTIERIYLEGLN